MPAIEKGIRSVMKEGILAGFTISGIKASVFDGKMHPVDSKPIAFEIAGREAFKNRFQRSRTGTAGTHNGCQGYCSGREYGRYPW